MPETETLNDLGEGELSARRWSVISFERCESTGLSYEQAAAKLAELDRARVSGLCVVTAEAADRLPR